MHKPLIPALVLVIVAIVLGSTVFREQIVHAATTPFPQVVVQNTSTNPVPVWQIGTSTTSVSGTVGIDPGQNTVNLGSGGNTVKLDSAANTVNLDATDAANLAKVENDLGGLKFNSSGELETTAQAASPGAVTEHCLDLGESITDVKNDQQEHTLCTDDFYATNITAAGMDDAVRVQFLYQGNVVLDLDGSSGGFGADSYQLDLTHPLHIDQIQAVCGNSSTNCGFSLAVLGNSTGT